MGRKYRKYEKGKHIDHKYDFIKEYSEKGIIEPRDVVSEDNPAEGFTKPLMKTRFEKFRDIICVKTWN